MELSSSEKCTKTKWCFGWFINILDLICSSSDGRLCLVKASSGKVKVRIDDLFSSKSTIGAFVCLDDNDKLLAVGNDDGDIKVSLLIISNVYDNS